MKKKITLVISLIVLSICAIGQATTVRGELVTETDHESLTNIGTYDHDSIESRLDSIVTNLGGGGEVSISGTPEVDQLAIWTDDSTITGDPLIGVNSVGILTNQVNEISPSNGVFIEGVEFIDGVIEMVHGTGRTPGVTTRAVLWSSSADKMPYWKTTTSTHSIVNDDDIDTAAAQRIDINLNTAARLDTVSFSDELHSFPFGIGGGLAGDADIMVEDAYMGGWYIAGDTVCPDTLHLWCMGTGGSLTVGGFYGPLGTAIDAGTAFFTAQAITTTGGLVTISTGFTDVPPGNRIWMRITAVTTEPLLVLGDLVHHKK